MSMAFSKSHRLAWLFLSWPRELIHQENATSYHCCMASRKIKCMVLLKGGKKRHKLRLDPSPLSSRATSCFHDFRSCVRYPFLCRTCTVSQRFTKCSGGQRHLTSGMEFQLLTAFG